MQTASNPVLTKYPKYPNIHVRLVQISNSESHELSSVRMKYIIEENYSYLESEKFICITHATKWMVQRPCKISTYLNGKNYYIFKVE